MVHKERFGTTKDGETASRFILENSKGMSVEISDFGALVLAIKVPDKNGIKRDVALGFASMEAYYNTAPGFGAYVGRNANRIEGAEVTIEGITYTLDMNSKTNNLHSGYNRSHCKFYQAKTGENQEGSFVELTRMSPDMEQGFPGNLDQKITYTLTEDGALLIDYEMQSDKTTVVNPTNHSYFNLNGHNSGSILEHELEIYTDKVLEINDKMIPTGKILQVEGTPMDFRIAKPIGRDIAADYPILQIAGGYDHNYVFPDDRVLKKVAEAYSKESGIVLETFTDLCGLQLYTANFLHEENGKENAVYEKREAFCLETQFYPNACRMPSAPSPILPAGKVFQSRTIYKFGNR